LSQALTLFTTPVIYLYLDELSVRFRGRRQKKRAARVLADASGEAAGPPLGGHT
jgi:hypothetical protein